MVNELLKPQIFPKVKLNWALLMAHLFLRMQEEINHAKVEFLILLRALHWLGMRTLLALTWKAHPD